jgi:hypothetical protein
MPINYKEYHPKWKLISKLIRFKRAGNKCEICGAPNHTLIYRDKNNWHLWPEGMQSEALTLDGIKSTMVVLTVAHLDHDKTNNRFWNLKALCQRCHLNHDIKHHVFNRKYGRKTKYLNGKLF